MVGTVQRLPHVCIAVPAQVSVNESLDPAVIIARLKQEVRDLREEVALLKGGAPQRGPLTPDELLRLRQQLLAFVDDEAQAGATASDGSCAAGSSSGGLNFGGDMMMIRASEWWSLLSRYACCATGALCLIFLKLAWWSIIIAPGGNSAEAAVCMLASCRLAGLQAAPAGKQAWRGAAGLAASC
jgi:hypothetical protein